MKPWIIADLVLVAILVISFLIVSGKGMVKCIYNLTSVIITVLAVIIFTTPLYDAFATTEFSAKIDEYVTSALTFSEDEASPVEETSFMADYITKKTNEIKENEISPAVSEIIKKILCAVVLYLAVKLLLFVVFMIIQSIFKFPVLNSVNKIFGGAIGLVSGLAIVYVICAVISLDVSNGVYIREIIDRTYITKYFYDNNLLMNLIF